MPNSYAILGVISYFINQYRRQWYVVLGLCEVISKHSSENIVAILLKLIKEYGFEGNVGYFIGDNTESNNIYINAVL